MKIPLKRSVIITKNKFCKKCKAWKNRSDFVNDKNRKDGKYPECKNCKNSPKDIVVSERITKFCNSCKINHPENEFSSDKRVKSGLQGSCRESRKTINTQEKSRVRSAEYHHKNYKDILYRAKHLYRGARDRAVRRNMEFSLDLNKIFEILKTGTCERSKILFDFERSEKERRNPFAPSIDRIDSFKGYTSDNLKAHKRLKDLLNAKL